MKKENSKKKSHKTEIKNQQNNVVDFENLENSNLNSSDAEIVNLPIKNIENDNASKIVSLGNTDDNIVHRKVKMQCNNCFIKDTCFYFKQDSDCSVDFKKLFEIERKLEDLPKAYLDIMEMQFIRIQRAYLFEMENQGILDPNLTREIEVFSDMMLRVKKLMEKHDSVVISATGEAVKSGGILSKLLGMDK